MEDRFLTTARYLKGKLIDLVESLFLQPYKDLTYPVYEDYSLEESLQLQKSRDTNFVGIYTSKDGNPVIIKSLRYKLRNLAYEQFVNEINVLKAFNKISKNDIFLSDAEYDIRIPNLLDIKKGNNLIASVHELIEGELLVNKPKDVKFKVLKESLKFLKGLRSQKARVFESLPARTPFQMSFFFPVYCLIAILKNVRGMGNYLKLAFIYYRKYFRRAFSHIHYGVVHKDLHSRNIIVRDKTITIIDPQVAVLSEKETDLAICARVYWRELGGSEILKLLDEFLDDNSQIDNFLRLTIFFLIQSLALDPKGSEDYEESRVYLSGLLLKVIPHLEIGKAKKNLISQKV